MSLALGMTRVDLDQILPSYEEIERDIISMQVVTESWLEVIKDDKMSRPCRQYIYDFKLDVAIKLSAITSFRDHVDSDLHLQRANVIFDEIRDNYDALALNRLVANMLSRFTHPSAESTPISPKKRSSSPPLEESTPTTRTRITALVPSSPPTSSVGVAASELLNIGEQIGYEDTLADNLAIDNDTLADDLAAFNSQNPMSDIQSQNIP